MYWFIADEHLGHTKILKYANRPFKDIEEHDAEVIKRHNEVVSSQDIVIHAGDFCWCNSKKEATERYISKLSGSHIFLVGSHDHWLPHSAKYIYRKRFDGTLVFVCHYAMRTWEASHYNSFHLYGHSHGGLEHLGPYGKSFDIGVDNHNFYPWSWDEIKEEMSKRPDNFNLVCK